MTNIIDYVKKYKDYSFSEVEFNIIDNLIMASLSYINFKDILFDNSLYKLTIKEAGEKYFHKYSKKDLKNDVMSVVTGNKIFLAIYNTKRYGDLTLCNYCYKVNDQKQFSALQININSSLAYLSFEGTDSLISGWYEDAEMSYKYPVSSQKEAILYINRHVNLFSKKKYLLGGHSKGGNLALVAGMHANNLIKNRIKGIYLFDAPGLRQEQIDSLRFKNIKNKINAYIPNFSIVGLLFRHVDELQVVKSKKKNVWAHNIINWEIDDKDFVYTELDYLSQRLESSITDWLDKYNDEERKKFVDDLFAIFKRAKINSIMDFKKQTIKKIRLVILESKKIEPKSKEVVDSLFKVLFGLFKEESSSFVKEKISKLKH